MFGRGLAAVLLGACLSGCALTALVGYEPGKTSEDALGNDALVVAANELMEADRAFAARSLDVGASQAFADFMDVRSVQIPVEGAPILGRDPISKRLADGPPFVLSWEPRYAEVFAPGDWGWTWGEWKAFEPGAGGRRLSRGKYLNIWKRQPDGTWKVRVDMGSQQKEK